MEAIRLKLSFEDETLLESTIEEYADALERGEMTEAELNALAVGGC